MPSISQIPHFVTQAPWEIPDPGDGGTIDIRESGVVNIVTLDAETRKLPEPLHVGQFILLNMKTDGGDGVVSVYESDLSTASAINPTGNNTITFANAGEAILLIGVAVGTAYKWRAWALKPETDGPALSTV